MNYMATAPPKEGELEKTRRRNPSKINQKLGKGPKRYIGVSSTLDSVMSEGYYGRRNIIQELNRISDYQGIIRFLVGLTLNGIMSKACEEGDNISVINKSLIDKTWSAIEKWREEAKQKSEDEASKDRMRKRKKKPQLNEGGTITEQAEPVLYKSVREFLSTAGFDLRCIPDKCKFDLRQRTCDDIATNCVSHISRNFYSRVTQHMKYIITNTEGIVAHLTTAEMRKPLLSKMMSIIFSEEEYNDSKVDELLEFIKDSQLYNDAITKTKNYIERCRDVIDNMVTIASRDTKRKVGLAYALKSHPHICIPFLYELSKSAEQISNIRTQIIEESKELSRESRKVYIKKCMKERECENVPKTFTLVPMYKLVSCYVDYGSTEIETLFYNKEGINMKHVQNTMFDIKHIPQIKNGSMILHSFRTDGLEQRGALG